MADDVTIVTKVATERVETRRNARVRAAIARTRQVLRANDRLADRVQIAPHASRTPKEPCASVRHVSAPIDPAAAVLPAPSALAALKLPH